MPCPSITLLFGLFILYCSQAPDAKDSNLSPSPPLSLNVSILCGKKEIEHCITCTNGSLCKTCDEGYGPKYPDLSACYDCTKDLGKTNTTGFNCANIMCNILMTNCQECTEDDSGCKTCALRSRRVGDQCVACEDNDRMGENCADRLCAGTVIPYCSECEDKRASCKTCDEDYQLTDKGRCEPCPEGTSGNNCRQKQCNGFAIYDCKVYGPDNSMMCRECNDDYKLDVYEQTMIDGVLVSLGKCVVCPDKRLGPECSLLKCEFKKLEHCTSCGTWGKCSVCFDGYAPNTSGICTPCESGLSGVNCVVRQCGFNLFEGCASCDQIDPNACGSCSSGRFKSYTLDNIFYESCVECPLGCASCESLSKCTRCLSGYSGDMCTVRKCSSTSIENCVKCDSRLGFLNKCSKCRDTTTLVDGQCVIKGCGIAHCVECKNDGTPQCTTCDEGYYLNPSPSGEQDICISCAHIPGCQVCDSTGVCLICASNASPGPEGGPQCIFCESITLGCAKCVGDTRTCTDCKSGMFLFNGECLSCQDRCLKCLSDGRCLGCETGYYVSETHTCAKCMDNCAICSSATSCGTCAPGYFLSTSNGVSNCLTCIENCAECKQTGTASFECTNCAPGYYLAGTQCVKCLANCELCEREYHCSVCAQGFYLTLDTTSSPITMICQQCDPNCEICSLEKKDGKSICEKAAKGFYITESKTIEQCMENCLSCDNGTQCNLAMDGYYYNSEDASINPCSEGCRLCIEKRGSSSGSTCYECVAGYQLSLFNGVNICVFPKSNSQTNTGLIVGVIVFIIVLILIVVTVVLLIRLRKRMDREDAIFCEQNTTLIPDGQGLEYQDSEEP